MRSSVLRVAIGLLAIVTACGTTPGTTGSSPGQSAVQSAGPQSAPSSAAGSTDAEPSAAVSPSAGAAYDQDECYANEYDPANSALSTLILLWPTIGYYVTDDATWQSTNATDQALDVAAYRAAFELVKDLPDATENGAPPWSEYAPKAGELADLLEQAEASGTPFADGIGDRIRALASDLNSNYIAIAHAVDALCPPEPASAKTTAEITSIPRGRRASQLDGDRSPRGHDLLVVHVRVDRLDGLADDLLRRRNRAGRLRGRRLLRRRRPRAALDHPPRHQRLPVGGRDRALEQRIRHDRFDLIRPARSRPSPTKEQDQCDPFAPSSSSPC